MKIIGNFDPSVSADDFRRARHISPDTDEAYNAVLASAEDVVTKASNLALTPRNVEFTVPVTGWRRWFIPTAPVNGLTSIETQDADGVWQDQDVTAARLQRGHDAPQLVLPDTWAGWSECSDYLRIVLSVGYVENPPPGLRQAIILMAAEFYEAGIAVDEVETHKLSFGAMKLIKQARYRRICEFAGA